MTNSLGDKSLFWNSKGTRFLVHGSGLDFCPQAREVGTVEPKEENSGWVLPNPALPPLPL